VQRPVHDAGAPGAATFLPQLSQRFLNEPVHARRAKRPTLHVPVVCGQDVQHAVLDCLGHVDAIDVTGLLETAASQGDRGVRHKTKTPFIGTA
jgi:NAD-dependent oxidoreductase involved in siderophore biosynthesis